MAYTNIDDPSAHFQVTTYTGAGANQTVTNDGNSDLQPDLLWIKRRNADYGHNLFDTTRGIAKLLEPQSTALENTNQTWISSVGSDSFTIGVNEHNLSNSAGTYVAWQWKANGGTTASNSNGSITSTVQANTTAGFSIVTYTGTGSIATVGHGLGVKPDMMILKNRDASNANWVVYHKDINASANFFLRLNTSDSTQYSGGRFNGTQPTSSLFTVGTSLQTNNNGDDIVAYCFAEKQGYSKFGKYIGNSEGGFAYCARLAANQTSAEATGSFTNVVDFLSNGFKFRNTDSAWNRNAGEYIFMAFAEHPLVTSGGAPCPAR